MSEKKQAKLSKNRIKRVVIISFLCVLAVICSIVVVHNVADASRLNAQKKSVVEQLKKQESTNKELRDVRDTEDKSAYLEEKAREQGYVKDGEVVYHDIG